MKFGLKDSIIEKIQTVFIKYPQLEKVIIYGSRAKGNYRNGSDIDITLKGNNLDLEIQNKISLEIDDLLLPYKFDISIFEQIENQNLKDHINRVGQIFYEKQ
jgi:predicted nucleotidyltransferase